MKKISYSDTIKSNQLKPVRFDHVINSIRSNQLLKVKVEELRQLQSDRERQDYKIRHLPYFSLGLFRNNIRRKENFISTHSILLDIDHLEQNRLGELRDRLKTDDEVFFFFISPGGNGLKVVVECDREINDPDQYERIYRSYAYFFSLKYGVEVDTQTCDCSRACFLSYDEDIYFNKERHLLSTADWLEKYESVSTCREATDRAADQPNDLAEVIGFLISKNNENGRIYNDYRNWQLLGLALASLGEAGRQYFLDLSMGNKKYRDNEDVLNSEYEKLLLHYGHTGKQLLRVGMLYYIALQHGYVLAKEALSPQPEDYATPVAPVSEQSRILKDELKEIAALNSETEREIFLKTLAEKYNVSIRSLKNDLKSLMTEEARIVITNEKIILAHPSYDVREDFLVIGFKETVVINNNPEDRNLFLVNYENNYFLTGEKFLKLDNTRIVFDLRGREMININDRWSRKELDCFLADPSSPGGTYKRIKECLKKHIYFQKQEHYGIVGAWIIATYFHRCFYAFLYLSFFGKKQTAKSRALELLERLAFNAVKIKGTSVASFVDTIDGLRGAFLTDQAESLSDSKNTEIIGYHADSYTVGGGRRRIMQIINGVRKVLSFESFGPKAYSAQKELDQDLRDRCVIIAMIRHKKDYPYPAAHMPIWSELRNDLYRLMLTKWKEVQQISLEAGNDVSMRIRELWRPLDTVLKLEKVSEKEISNIKKVFLDSMVFSQDVLSEKEIFLIEALLALTEALKDDPRGVSLSASDIGNRMKAMAQQASVDLGFDKDRGMHTWIGFAIKRLSLFTAIDKNSTARKHAYIFHFSHINEIFDRFKEKIIAENEKDDQKPGAQGKAEMNQKEIFPDSMEEFVKGMVSEFKVGDAE